MIPGGTGHKTLQRVALSYGAAAAATGVATALRLALAPWLGPALPFSTYFVATLFVVWYFGFGPALFNILVSAVAGLYFFVSAATTSPFYSTTPTGRVTVLGYIIASLAASFLLDLQRKTLERVNREVDGRKAAEQELRVANSALARSNEDLQHFAFAASHDLQEPLRMITAYSQLLLRRYPERFDGEASTLFENIVDGTKRMRDLIADLLAYTQLGSEPVEPSEVVDLHVILDCVRANLMPSIIETGALITAGQLPALQGNAGHFTSLFQNLISNAIKYRSDQPPRIHISAQRTNGAWQFAVADNGIGIDPQYHAQIFDVFKRLHGRAIPGTGVGLAICKRVVERYGGRMWVESRPGDGTTFFFSLPCVLTPATRSS